MENPRVIVVNLHVGDICVFLVGDDLEPHLIMADEEGEHRNAGYSACDIANNIAKALLCDGQPRYFDAPASLTQPEEWNYDDVGAWLQDGLVSGKL